MKRGTLFALLILTSSCQLSRSGTLKETVMPPRHEVQHPGLVSVLTLDRSVIESGPANFLHATFTIRNPDRQPVPFTFPTSQRYDFTVEDESGRVRWKWSKDRFFTMMISTRELTGESWIFEEDIPTVDENQNPFPPGSYLLKAELTSERRLENQISFEIRRQ